MKPGARLVLLLACVALVMGSVGSAAAYPSGFSEELVAAGLTDPTAIAFFPDGRYKSNFLCNLGYGDASTLFARGPRPAFEETCTIA